MSQVHKLRETVKCNFKRRILRKSFLTVFTVCAISTHFWTVAHIPRVQHVADIMFALRCIIQSITMDYLILKRKEILAMFDFFEKIDNLQVKNVHPKQRRKILWVFVVLSCVSYIIAGSSKVYNLNEEVREYFIFVLCFGYGANVSRGVKTFILLLDNALFHINIVLLVVCFPLLYAFFVKVILNEVSTLKDNIERKRNSMSFKIMLDDTHESLCKIRNLVKEVNRCLGSTVLAWSGIALVAFFHAITHTRYNLDSLDPIGNTLSYFMGVGPTLVLVILSVSLCSKVTTEMQGSFELLHSLSKFANREGLTNELHLLLYGMSVPELAMSVGGCFVFNRQFCFSYICLAISYATIVFQLP